MKSESDNDLVICRCEEVTEKAIKEAIAEGARTLDAVKRRTRAGMGFCQGCTCGRLVSRLIAKETGKSLSEIPVASRRPPVRPIRLSVLASEEGNYEE